MLWSLGNHVFFNAILIVLLDYFISFHSPVCDSGGYFNLIRKGLSIIPLLQGG